MRQSLAPYNVVAIFPDETTAKEAIAALRQEAVAVDDISILGRLSDPMWAELTLDRLDIPEHTSIEEKLTARGALVGATAGTLAGALVTALAFSVFGVGAFVGSVVWTTLGGAIGGAWGKVQGENQEFWEAVRSIQQGRALVGVHSEDPSVIDRAEPVLVAHQPLRIDRLDEEGNLVGIDYQAPGEAPVDLTTRIDQLEATVRRLGVRLDELEHTRK